MVFIAYIDNIRITDVEKKKQGKVCEEIKNLVNVYKIADNIKNEFSENMHYLIDRIMNFKNDEMVYELPDSLLETILIKSCNTDIKTIKMKEKLDSRSLEFLIWHLICGNMYEIILQTVLYNLIGLKLEKSGEHNILADMSVVNPDEDFTYREENGNIRKIEVQRVNYILTGKSLEIKYHKRNSDLILCYLTNDDVVKILLLDPKKEKYRMIYSDCLPICHKKGFEVEGITEFDFIKLSTNNVAELRHYFLKYLSKKDC